MSYRDPHIAEVIQRVTDITAHAEHIARPLNKEQLLWRPGKKVWSIAEILQHVIVTADAYYGVMRKALSETSGPVEGEVPDWRHRLGGKFLMRGITSRRRLKTLKVFKPLDAGPGVVDDFVRCQKELIELLHQADGYDVNAVRFASPATWLVRLNLGDAFIVLALHAQRHLQQAERLTRMPGFPRSPATPAEPGS